MFIEKEKNCTFVMLVNNIINSIINNSNIYFMVMRIHALCIIYYDYHLTYTMNIFIDIIYITFF